MNFVASHSSFLALAGEQLPILSSGEKSSAQTKHAII
jgi:hypothetical protein